jgi:protease I
MPGKALMVTGDGFEDMELYYPLYRLQEAGWEVQVAAARTGTIKGIHGYTVRSELTFDQSPAAYDLLVLPGGRAPRQVREDDRALALVRAYWASRRPLAAICHGPQILIAAGLVAGRRMTAYHTVQKELTAAGALVEDAPVVVDGRLVTSRGPNDLPYFARAVFEVVAQE